MDWLHKAIISRERGAALVIVLALVVLLTGVGVAYLSRTTSDRQVAHASFNQSKADQLVASATDNIIGDLRQEIVNGSTRSDFGGDPPNQYYVYTPRSPANMVPQRSGNLAAAPNLIRRSVSPDNILPPGLGSFASAVNSAPLDPTNPKWGDITKARWNRHYLVPKANTTDDGTDPITSFAAPDWVFVTSDTSNRNAGRRVIGVPDQTVIGRYAYAIYDESGLLDMNVAGYPTNTTTTQFGRKGSTAYADLTALGNYPIPNGSGGSYLVDRLVGWRNYATTQPTNNFPDTGPPANRAFAYNFQTDTTPATAFYNYVINNTNGFLSPSAAVWSPTNNNNAMRTDQSFVQRQELTAYRKAGTGGSLSPNALQYLSTFSRETNSPSFSPSTPVGSTIDYAALASTSTAINPNFLLRRVTTSFTRFDGTAAVVGEPLVKTRFPLRRLAWITYKGPSALRTLPPQIPALPATDPNYDMWALQWIYGIPASYLQLGTVANIKLCFGLTFGGTIGNPTYPWIYTNPTGAGATNRIMRLDEVAAAGREPDFFELLQAGILNGSLGQNTGGGVTGGNVFPDIHMNNTMQHVLTIGASIIDQGDPDSIPTRIQFNPSGTIWTAYGVENLPYITQIYPIAGTSPDDPTQWATYLLFQLWNPHQNASALPNNVRLRVDGAIGLFRGGNGQSWTPGNPPQILANGSNAGQSVTLNSAFSFSAPAPLTATNTINAAPAPGPPAGGAFAVLPAIP
jgi:hypothetical protein